MGNSLGNPRAITTDKVVSVHQLVSVAQSVSFCVQTYHGVGHRLNSLTIVQVANYEKVR